jgi:predicted ATP-grasp superfamily ATP-dependent carboligase
MIFDDENTAEHSWPRPRRFLGTSLEAVHVCSDKLALARLLLDNSITTPVTKPFYPYWKGSPWWRWPSCPSVIKPRDGAGSQNTFLVRNSMDLWNACRELSSDLKNLRTFDAFIHQPYVVGKSLSVALLIAEDGSIIEVLPVAEQHLSDDGRFRYLGGRIPADISAESAVAVQQLAVRTCRAVPGLTGYVGCDIVLPHGEPVLIEINPRLTTSYLGYRTLTDDNIAARLLDSSTPPLRWKSDAVTFTA